MSEIKSHRPGSEASCPCGSGQPFGNCCEPILERQRPAATAEELMRSRFTAHAIGDFEHLHRTYLPTAEKAFAGERWGEPEAKWTRLVIHAHELGPKPEMAMVDFSAYFQADDGTEHAHHEKAEFKQIQRTWYYTRPLREGPPPVRSTAPKVGRNDPCPCGSGKKYKHCCGR